MANNKKSFTKDALFCTLLTFIVASILYFSFINISALDPFEKAFEDFRFTDIFYSERFKKSQRNTSIVLVNVKHADRFFLAQAIDKISSHNPKVIGLDIIFKDLKLEFTDSILKSSIGKSDKIVGAYFHDIDSIVKNHKFFDPDKTDNGYINLNLEGQNIVVRDFLGAKKENENIDFAFATQVAISAGYIDEDFAIKKLKDPIPINYIGNKDVFLNFDIEDIMTSDNIPALKNAIILLGYLGDENPEFDIEDKHFTPLNSAWIGRAAPDTYGLTIHANILNMILKNDFITKVPNFFVYLFAAFCTFLVVLLSMKLYKRNSFVFDLLKKLIQLIFTIAILYLALLLLQLNVYINVIPILLFSILGVEMIDFYEHLIIYLNKKFHWKSQLL